MTPLQLALLLRMAELATAQNTYTPLARVEEMRLRVQTLRLEVEAEKAIGRVPPVGPNWPPAPGYKPANPNREG